MPAAPIVIGRRHRLRRAEIIKSAASKRLRLVLPFRENLSTQKPPADTSLAHLLNLGPKSAAWLVRAGVHSRDEVMRLGVIETCRRVRAAGYPASVLLAFALEGALAGCHWRAIPGETRDHLRIEFAKLRTTETRRLKATRRG